MDFSWGKNAWVKISGAPKCNWDDYKKISFIIHPESYVHAIVVYNNGISKIVAHDTTMKIPIFNTIFNENAIYRGMKKIDFKKLNHLNFQDVMIKKYPIVSFLNKIPKKHSLYETVILSINDTIVEKFLEKKIRFNDIATLFLKFIDKVEFKKYKKRYPKKIMEIINLNNLISKKISSGILEWNGFRIFAIMDTNQFKKRHGNY